MPRTLAKRLDVILPSPTLAMSAKANALRATGADVYAFSVGEPDFEPPRHVLDAAKAAVDKGVSKYTAVTGIPALKTAICESTTRTRGWTPTPDMVSVTVGAKHALFNLAIALYEPGDEVHHPRALLGQLPGAGPPDGRDAGDRRDRGVQRLAAHPGGAGEGAHAEDQGGHPVHAVQPHGRGLPGEGHPRRSSR